MPLSQPSVPVGPASTGRNARTELELFCNTLNGRILEGGFAVGKVLSVGTYGCVCNGLYMEEDTRVAIKVAPYGDIFLNHEVRLLKLVLKCRWIPTPIGTYGIDKTHQFLALSMEGQPIYKIQQFWEPASPMIPVTLNVLLECVRGLEYLHGKGIIHRDVHTGNVLLPETKGKGKIVLIDFGLSAIREADGSFTCVKDVSKLSFVFHTPWDVMHGSSHCELDDIIQLVYMGLRFRSSEVVEGKSLDEFHAFKKQLSDDPNDAIPYEDDFLVPFAKAVFKQQRYGKNKLSVKPNYGEIKAAIKNTLGYDASRGIY